MLQRFTVNRFMIMSLPFVLGCHLGRPKPPDMQYNVGQVVAPVAEPGLADALKSGLAASLSQRSLLGEGGAKQINVAVLSATTVPTGVGPSSQVHTARLQFSVQVGDRRATFSAERSFTVIDTVQGATARAEAFTKLANHLTGDAALWISTAPSKRSDGEVVREP